ncbi:uncharacterized protein MONOS_10217 [Monocercomonoides exilis]|uniref:uncharacterized protein n=1 Tax=Monocercomonoides exilis TaxID=2049356 RepID=UPI003559442B|nr:hypothetical protein MONOS_10217 [Monocercomonoides exilis]|eukprot:MONOS_10217.1-p1 / transcript=MONOS_10217.1 / gene=MONOS_10217 / organism=Monocercomonoides_exilis_PA203 / gene_product=unspecified product / transcript_product=unspecified product / location=Mono_scaffold00455:10479-11383(-) / protein_length=202 / sequence_SO=supercontig / SO=protein_coding / is_pseudo=false
MLPQIPSAEALIPPGAYVVEGTDQIRIDNPCSLTIDNLPQKIHLYDFKKIFSGFGRIVSCEIKNNTKFDDSKRGYVEFSLPTEASLAMKKVDGQYLYSKKIKIRYSHNDIECAQKRKLIFCGFGDVLREQQIRRLFEEFGELEDISLRKDDEGFLLGDGFVIFENMKSAINAAFSLNGKKVQGIIISVKLAFCDRHQKFSQL